MTYLTLFDQLDKMFCQPVIKDTGFPKYNIKLNKKTGQRYLEIGLAGYTPADLKDAVKVINKAGYRVLQIATKASRPTEVDIEYKVAGLPFRAFKLEQYIANYEVTDTTFENGLLTIELSPTEPPAETVTVNFK